MANKINFTELKKNVRDLMKANGIGGLIVLGIKALGCMGIMFVTLWVTLMITNIPAILISAVLGDNKVTAVITVLFSFAGTILVYVLMMFFLVGLATTFKNFVQSGNLKITDILAGFKSENKVLLLKTMFKFYIFTFLWSLLCVVPGIIYGYKMVFVPFILSENPDMTSKEIMELSKEMTNGLKMDMFVAILSTIGWYFLAGITSCLVIPIFIYMVYTWSIISGAYITRLNDFYGDTNTEAAQY